VIFGKSFLEFLVSIEMLDCLFETFELVIDLIFEATDGIIWDVSYSQA